MNSTAFETADRMQANTQIRVPFGGRAMLAPVSISLGGMLFCDMNEEWRPVAGYEGYYEVSNTGRVRSLERTAQWTLKGLPRYRPIRTRLLKPTIWNKKRIRFNLSLNGKRRMKFAHRLVCEAFLNNPNLLPEVNHLDGNPLNNRVDNLEWCNRRHNHNHAVINGLLGFKVQPGEQHGRSRLTNEDVIQIRTLSEIVTASELAKKFHVSDGCVRDVIQRRTWKHL